MCVCVFIQKLHIRKHSAMFLQIFLHAQIFSRTPAATSKPPRQMPAARRRLSVGYVCVKFHRFVTVRLMRFCKVNNKSAYGNGFLRTCCPRNSRKVSEKFTQALQDSHYQAFAAL